MAEQDALPLEGGESGPKEAEKVEISADELKEMRDDRARLQSELETQKIERAKLEARLEQSAAAPKEPEQQRISKEQLQAWVDNGQITQSDMDRELARQMREDITKDVETKLSQKFEQKEQLRNIKGQFDSYVKLRPDVKVEGTEDRRRFQEEFQALVDLGQPVDMRTEVLAMRAAFGSLDRVKETTRSRREVHQETGGGSGAPEKGSSGAEWEKGLTSEQVSIYKAQLERGLYPSAKDPMFLRVTNRARTGNTQKAKKAS